MFDFGINLLALIIVCALVFRLIKPKNQIMRIIRAGALVIALLTLLSFVRYTYG